MERRKCFMKKRTEQLARKYLNSIKSIETEKRFMKSVIRYLEMLLAASILIVITEKAQNRKIATMGPAANGNSASKEYFQDKS